MRKSEIDLANYLHVSFLRSINNNPEKLKKDLKLKRLWDSLKNAVLNINNQIILNAI